MKIIIDKDLPVPMRDGTTLAADVYRLGLTGPSPTLVARLPYNKDSGAVAANGFDVHRAVMAGYAVVVQDTRGRFASAGEFTPFVHEAADGADTVTWAARQPWSTGQVGMIGGSYLGAAQWAAAAQAPSPLRALAPVAASDHHYYSWTYQGGAFQLGFSLWWALTILASGELRRRRGNGDDEATARLGQLLAAADDPERLYGRLPLRGRRELAGLADYYDGWLAHEGYDGSRQATAPREMWSKITAPALSIGGWFDVFLQGTLANYTGMRANGGSAQARSHQRLVIGPWAHGALTGTFPERSFGITSGIDGVVDLAGLQLQWFDWLLKGEDTALDHDRPVRLFVMGPDAWRDEADWPLPDTQYVDWFLHSSGGANTAGGDGTLSREVPAIDEPEDRYRYDPRRPVPTHGGASFLPGLFIGANSGPRDQRAIEARADVLCYTSAPLPEPLTVIGPLTLVVHVSSSAPDTDFTAKLVDVEPDGRAMSIADGIMRARYRHSLSEAAPLHPGEVYELRISLVATAIVLAAGHRIRLEISSSNFPRFDRNTNTGGTIAEETEAEMQPAVNHVHHCAARLSRLVLPVVVR